MAASKLKVALYARVSRQEQNPDLQKKALIKKAEKEGWKFTFFEEKESMIF